MKTDLKKDIKKVQRLVGNISESNLKYVDYYVSDNLGIFIPSVGFCEYAIMPQHTHPAYSFILFFSKDQSFVPTKIKVLPKHYLVTAISPDVPHEENETDTFTRYIAIIISRELYDAQYEIYSGQPPENYIWEQFLVGYDIMIYLKKFMAEYENRVIGSEKVLEALAVIITHQLIRNILKINSPTDIITEKFEIEEVVEYMNQHFGKKLSVDGMAKKANMSQSHFIRIFKKETGMAPMEYLIKMRIEKAKKLLRSGTKNITEISLQCGFNSTSHFSSSFARHAGMTPSDYQNTYSERNSKIL